MSEGSSAIQIKKAIGNVYKPDYEFTYFKNIISAFYLQGTDPDVVEKILRELYNHLPSHEKTLDEIIKLFEDIYLGEENPNSGIKGIERFISDNYDKKTSILVGRELNRAIIPYDTNKIYKLQTGSNKYIIGQSYHMIPIRFTNSKPAPTNISLWTTGTMKSLHKLSNGKKEMKWPIIQEYCFAIH